MKRPNAPLDAVHDLHGAVSPEPGASARGELAAAHDEWLLDQALGETFPASDPISPFCSRLEP